VTSDWKSDDLTMRVDEFVEMDYLGEFTFVGSLCQ
jgi:hypothetical protein